MVDKYEIKNSTSCAKHEQHARYIHGAMTNIL